MAIDQKLLKIVEDKAGRWCKERDSSIVTQNTWRDKNKIWKWPTKNSEMDEVENLRKSKLKVKRRHWTIEVNEMKIDKVNEWRVSFWGLALKIYGWTLTEKDIWKIAKRDKFVMIREKS